MDENASMRNPKPIKHRQGTFDGHTIDGIWLEDQEGKRAWRIVLVSHEANRLFMVFGKAFRSVQMDTSAESKETMIVVGEAVTDLHPLIRQCVLDKIGTWEKEESDAFPADDLF